MKLKPNFEPNFEIHLICNKKEVSTEIKGDMPSILAALATFVEDLKDLNVPKEIIEYAVKLGLEQKEETEKMKEKNIEEILRKIFD